MQHFPGYFLSAVTRYLNTHKRPFFLSAGFLLCSFLLMTLARNIGEFGSWYSSHLYPVLPNTLGRLLSPLPFSLFELLICLALLAAGGFLVFALVSLRHTGGRRRLRRAAGRGFPIALCVIAAMFFMQTLTCFLNYSRVDFPDEIGISTYPAADEDLKELCELLISDLNGLIADSTQIETAAGQDSATTSAAASGEARNAAISGSALQTVPDAPLLFDEKGSMSLKNIDVGAQAKAAMKKLGETYSSLSGYYPNPKPIFFSRAMSTVSLTGIFSPYTTEANYNNDVTPYVIPYTICHELAHVKGYIKENEAGFIAYLAASGADSPQLRYSGALNALSYSLNALYRNVSKEEYQAILRQVPAQALTDLRRNQAYWQEFRQGVRGAISQTARAANDTYLRANAQSDGAKSYGRMVDLLLAYYKIGAEEL